MTYREKLQKEHPEKVGDMFVGGCSCCPGDYGYGPDNWRTCKGCNEKNCRACWDKEIPNTSEIDELNQRIKDLEELLKDKELAILNYEKACDVKGEMINDLINIVKEKDQKITNLEGACSSKNREIVELREELDREKTRKYFWCEDNCCAMTKDREIQRLNKLLDKKDSEIHCLNDRIDGLNKGRDLLHKTVAENNRDLDCKRIEIDALKKDLEKMTNIAMCYQMTSHSTYGICAGVKLTEKDREIEYLENDLRMTRELLFARDRIIERLNQALDEEKKEHAKHHGLAAIFHKI